MLRSNEKLNIFTTNLSRSYDIEVVSQFEPLTISELISIINSLNDKWCELNEIPVWLLKACVLELAPINFIIVSKSFKTSIFPSNLKEALVLPVVKNPSGDLNSLSNYRPIQWCKVTKYFYLSRLLE